MASSIGGFQPPLWPAAITHDQQASQAVFSVDRSGAQGAVAQSTSANDPSRDIFVHFFAIPPSGQPGGSAPSAQVAAILAAAKDPTITSAQLSDMIQRAGVSQMGGVAAALTVPENLPGGSNWRNGSPLTRVLDAINGNPWTATSTNLTARLNDGVPSWAMWTIEMKKPLDTAVSHVLYPNDAKAAAESAQRMFTLFSTPKSEAILAAARDPAIQALRLQSMMKNLDEMDVTDLTSLIANRADFVTGGDPKTGGSPLDRILTALAKGQPSSGGRAFIDSISAILQPVVYHDPMLRSAMAAAQAMYEHPSDPAARTAAAKKWDAYLLALAN